MDSCTLSSGVGPTAKDMKRSGLRSTEVRPRPPVLAWSHRLQGSLTNASSGPQPRGESPGGRGPPACPSKENTPPSKNATKHIARLHIRKADQNGSRSAGQAVGKDQLWSSSDSETSGKPIRRFARVHVISDEERASNIEADKLSADIRLPRAWQASWSLQKAQRQNRTQQKQLSLRLDVIDKGLVVQFKKITNKERRLLNEFLAKYPEMYHHVMGGLRDKATVRRLGIFPQTRAHDGSVPIMTQTQLQEVEAAVIRAHLKAPGGGEFPPLYKKKAQIITPQSPTRRVNQRYGNHSPQVTIQLKGVKCDDRDVDIEKEKEDAQEPSENKNGGFIQTPGIMMTSSTKNPNQQGVNVSYFVDTDFGFHPDRQRQAIAGMSLQKDIQDATQLEKDIAKVARKHINAMTTAGLNHRASRKMEGVENLRTTMYGRHRSGSTRGTPTGTEDNYTPTRILISPRGRRQLKSGGPLPPLDKDVTKVVVVGKADGPLVVEANKSIAANDNASFCDW